MNKIKAILAAVLLAIGITVVIPTGSAQAVWQCAVWTGGNPAYYAQARCDFGLGGVRVAGYCWNGSYDFLYYGPWKPAGQTSTMICNGGQQMDGAWYETF